MNAQTSLDDHLNLPRLGAGRVVTLALEGEVSERELKQTLDLLFRISHRGVTRVVLDFSEVSHFDYRGVKPLLARAELLRQAGGDLKLCGLSRYLGAIFRSAGAHDGFEYFEGATQAQQAFEPSSRACG